MIFRTPEYGNSFSTRTNLAVKRTVDNQQIVHSPYRLVIETFTMTIKGLNKVERDQFISLYLNSAGKIISFTDHENITWDGLIITPRPQIITNKRSCDYSTSFEFQGTEE